MRINELVPNEHNLREEIGKVDGLADSIESLGILQPLLVRPNGTIIAGHRRYAAIMRLVELGRWDVNTDVPVTIREDNGNFDTQAMLVENLQREGLNPIQEAVGYQRLLDNGMTQRDIASSIGQSQPHISKRLGLLKLPPVAQKAVVRGDLTVEQGYELVKLAGAPVEVFKEAIDFPTRIGAIVANHLRAEAIAEVEDRVREIGGTPYRREADIPKQRGKVAVVDFDSPLTVDQVGDLEGEEDVVVLTRVNSAGEGIGFAVEYVDKDLVPDKPKTSDPHEEARREAAAHRREQLAEILSKPVKKTDVTMLLVAWFADPDTHSTGTCQAAGKALGLKPLRSPDPYHRPAEGEEQKTQPDWRKTLVEHAGESAQKATMVLLAMLLIEAGALPYRSMPAAARATFDTLGYEPHDAEKMPAA